MSVGCPVVHPAAWDGDCRHNRNQAGVPPVAFRQRDRISGASGAGRARFEPRDLPRPYRCADNVTNELSVSPTSPCRDATAPWWHRAVFVLAVLLTGLAAIKSNVADPDLWGHVEFGREVLRTAELPKNTTWSFTSRGRWVNHENLAEVALAWTFDHAGLPGLIALKLALTLTILGLMVWRGCRAGAGWLTMGAVLLLVGRTMQFHWHFRPHVFGFAFFAILVALLDWAFENWSGVWRTWAKIRSGEPVPRPDAATARLRWLWFGPGILMLWTNTHGGYAAGTAIWCTYLGLRIVEAWCWWGRAASGLIRRLALMIAAGLAAICLNPYGPQLHLWLAEDVWLPRPEISDWHPLWSLGAEAWPFLLLLATSVAALAATRLRRDAVQLVILSLVLWQSLAHVRHVLFFALLCGFWIPQHLASALERLRGVLASRECLPPQAAGAPGMALAVALAWSGFVLTQFVPMVRTLPVETSRYPVAAMQFLRDHRLYGKTVVDFNWSQYAIACFASDPAARESARVAIDGRLRTCYSQPIIDIYLDFFLGAAPETGRYRSPQSGLCDPAKALSYLSPELLLLNRRNPSCREVMQGAGSEWRLLYEDDVAQVWGHRALLTRVDWPVDRAPATVSLPGPLPRQVDWPALPKTSPRSQVAEETSRRPSESGPGDRS